MPVEESFHQKLKKKKTALKNDRQPWEDYWKELIQAIDPRKGQFYDNSLTERGERSDRDLINNRIKQARRIAVSGLYAGTVSPSRPWFKLETLDRDMMRVDTVRTWMFKVEEIMRNTLLGSNFYSAAVPFIEELLDFSTAAMTHVDDPDRVAHFKTHTVGSYYAAHNDRGDVDTFALELQKTARQMWQAYGWEPLSPQVKNALDTNNGDRLFKIVQVVQPNEDHNPDMIDSKFKKFRATTFDPGDTREGQFLEDKGFDEMPAYVLRWQLVGNEVYGSGGPGMVALGDTRALQDAEKVKAKAVEKMVDPLLKGPPELKNLNIPNNRSNGLIVYDDFGSGNQLSPVYQVDPRVQELRIDMDGMERRINEAYFVDLFQSISSLQGIQPRNQLEISQRNEESLLVLGPMLERFQREFLQKTLDRVFNQLVRREAFPEPPEELQGQNIEVRFISTLAQAQRSVEVAALERFLLFGGQLAQIDPQAVDKIDVDAAIDLQSHLTGVTPSVVRGTEAVQEIREQRAQVQQQQIEAQQAQQQASANAQNASAIQQVSKAVGDDN